MGACSAINCTNRSGKYRVFRYPRDKLRRRQWILNSRRAWSPGPSGSLCEVHFEENQFESSRQDGWRKLKPNAVPTIFDVPDPPKRFMATSESKKRNRRKETSTINKSEVVQYDAGMSLVKSWQEITKEKDTLISSLRFLNEEYQLQIKNQNSKITDLQQNYLDSQQAFYNLQKEHEELIKCIVSTCTEAQLNILFSNKQSS